MTTINFNINDNKGGGNSDNQFQGSVPTPLMEVSEFSGVEESAPSPQSSEQDDFSSVGEGSVPRPQDFENLQGSDSSPAPSPMGAEGGTNSENQGGAHPSPMDFEALKDVKTTKGTKKSTASKSTKK